MKINIKVLFLSAIAVFSLASCDGGEVTPSVNESLNGSEMVSEVVTTEQNSVEEISDAFSSEEVISSERPRGLHPARLL